MADILIVEDTDVNMRLFTDILVDSGFSVIPAEDAETALELLERIPIPAAILMDIQLPGMSGVDCTKHLRADKRFQDVPIIALTAFAMDGDEKRCLEAGCSDYMAKPIAVSAFVQMVKKYSGVA